MLGLSEFSGRAGGSGWRFGPPSPAAAQSLIYELIPKPRGRPKAGECSRSHSSSQSLPGNRARSLNHNDTHAAPR
jgi:hypothetical protein